MGFSRRRTASQLCQLPASPCFGRSVVLKPTPCQRCDFARLCKPGGCRTKVAQLDLRPLSRASNSYTPELLRSSSNCHCSVLTMASWLEASLDWVMGTKRRRKETARQPPYFWEQPDLIDPPIRPLRTSRPRCLTNTGGTHDQLQSCLIARLPAEIRIQIWQHVVGRENDKDVLHFELADGILRHNRCYERESTLPGFKHDCWKAAWRKSFRQWALGGKEPVGHRRPILLPLLFTCKLVYALERIPPHGNEI